MCYMFVRSWYPTNFWRSLSAPSLLQVFFAVLCPCMPLPLPHPELPSSFRRKSSCLYKKARLGAEGSMQGLQPCLYMFTACLFLKPDLVL